MLRRLHCSLNLLIFWLLKTESITFQFLLSSENDGGQIWSVHCGSKAHCVRHFWRQPQKHQCYWTRNSRFASRSCSCRRSGRQNRPCGFRWDFQIWNNAIFNWRFFSRERGFLFQRRHLPDASHRTPRGRSAVGRRSDGEPPVRIRVSGNLKILLLGKKN